MSFPPGTEMFQFPGFASTPYVFRCGSLSRGGLPHSDIHGSKPARGSPWLLAACHVLHRLLAPRHPPDALLILTQTGRHAETRQPQPPCTGSIQTPAPALAGRAAPTSSLVACTGTHVILSTDTIRTPDHCPTQPEAVQPIQGNTHRSDKTQPSTADHQGTPTARAAKPPRSPSAARSAPEPDSRSPKINAGAPPKARPRAPHRPPRPSGSETKAAAPSFLLCIVQGRLAKHHGSAHGSDRDRTDDPLLAKQVLSQLSYAPIPSHPQPSGPRRRASTTSCDLGR